MRFLTAIYKSIAGYVLRVSKPERDARALKLNNDTDLLKIIACIAMIIDHMGKMIFPDAYVLRGSGELAFLFPAVNILRAVGRLAMPMFAYGIAVGAAYTRNVFKYVLRLLLMGILVHPLYMEAMGHVPIGSFDWAGNFYRLDLIFEHYYTGKLNIFFSLALGAAILGMIRAKAFVPSILLFLLAYRLKGDLDYGIDAIVLMGLFYAFLDKPLASFIAVFLFMLDWAMPSLITTGRKYAGTQIYAMWALVFIYLPLRKRYVKLPKFVFYAFYPAHLLLIYCLQL